MHMWLRGVVVITTAQLYSKKPELRFGAGSNQMRISNNGFSWKYG